MRKLPLVGISLAALLATGLAATATAQDSTGYQVDRHTMMEQVGEATRVLGGMARGDAPYEAGSAVNGMRVYLAVAAAWPHMFPEGTETGNDTRAAPAIWEDPEGFVAASEKFEADAAAAIETAGNGFDAFRAAFGSVAQNCRSCHEDYRTPDE
jgi:cytochrome c556